MSAHTAGPWSFERHNPKLFKVESTTARRVICDFYGNNPEDEANARLISAAPELLAALKALRNAVVRYEDDTELDTAKETADNALDRAEGST